MKYAAEVRLLLRAIWPPQARNSGDAGQEDGRPCIRFEYELLRPCGKKSESSMPYASWLSRCDSRAHIIIAYVEVKGTTLWR